MANTLVSVIADYTLVLGCRPASPQVRQASLLAARPDLRLAVDRALRFPDCIADLCDRIELRSLQQLGESGATLNRWVSKMNCC